MSAPSSEHTSLLGNITDQTNIDQEKDEKVSMLTFTHFIPALLYCLKETSIGVVLTSLSSTDGCQFDEVSCSNDCGKYLQKQHLANHLRNECVHRKVNCQYCQISGEYQFIEGEHEMFCPKFLPICPKNTEIVTNTEAGDDILSDMTLGTTDFTEAHIDNSAQEKITVLEQQVLQYENLLNQKIFWYPTILYRASKLSSGDEVAPVTVKMSDYIKNQKDEVDWYSDSFYTHNNGYKMCLNVRNSSSTHLSVYLYLMKGPHDDQLKWPLRGHCEVKLLNQISNCKHISKEGYCGNNHRIGSKVKSIYWYNPQFISKQNLLKTTMTYQYLRDDNIFLQVDYKLDH